MATAIITGASRGLGFALASQLADAGWNLIIDARDAGALHEAADALRISGSAACRAQAVGDGERVRIEPIAGDITDPAHRAALIRAAQAHGRLDLLINNAGTLGPSPLPPVADLDLDALRETFEVNTVAPLALTQLALPLLRRSRGTVIDITSDAAVEGYPGWGGYGASKAATEQLRNVLAAEEAALEGTALEGTALEGTALEGTALEGTALEGTGSKGTGSEGAGTGVTVLRVDPGDLRTRMHQDAFPGEDISDRPLPEDAAPGLLKLLATKPASGRYRLADYSALHLTEEPQPVTGPVRLWLTSEVRAFEPVAGFYRDALGLAEVDGWSIDGEAGAVFAIGSDGRIEIEQPAPEEQGPTSGNVRAAIEYTDADALTAAHVRLAAYGPSPLVAHHRGHCGFTVTDPAGVEIYLWTEKGTTR